MDKRPKWRTFVHENIVAILILAAAWLIFFSPLLFGGQVYFLDDLKILYLPIEHAFAEAQAAGVLPTWDYRFGFGHPLLAWGQLGFFVPLHVLLRALRVPPLELLQVSVAVYWAIGLAGMYAWFRLHRLGAAAAALGAAVFAFSGYQVGHLNHVNFYVATMVLPWLLVAIHRWLQSITVARSVALAAAVSVMVLSGHPQATLYALIIAAIYGLIFFGWRRPRLARRIGIILLAGLASAAVASIMLLPLFELVPETDRASGIAPDILYEFSYAPWHTITLIAPYFFGDHESYWGAKSFQELAAFVGLLPLMLAAGALSWWGKFRGLRRFGLLLVLLGIALALGKYSPVYRWLVDSQLITSLNIPGRFVLLFTTGISVLAAVGLEDVLQLELRSRAARRRYVGMALLIPAALLLPLVWYVRMEPRAWLELQQLMSGSPALLLAVAALLVFIALLWARREGWFRARAWVALVLTVGTLLTFGWNYNPRVASEVASDPSPLLAPLREYGETTGTPARLYSRPNLYSTDPEVHWLPSAPLSPSLTVLQPITLAHTRPCFTIPFYTSSATAGVITIGLHESIDGPALAEVQRSALDIAQQSDQDVCFPVDTTIGGEYVISFTSDAVTGVNPYYRGLPGELSAYFIRVANPTAAQVTQSQKQALVQITEREPSRTDREARLLVRHQQVQGNASAARWIGALGIRPFQRYINAFFDDNLDSLFDGDRRHLLARNRALIDAAGITHLAQSFAPEDADHIPDQGFTIIAQHDDPDLITRLYLNPQVMDKAHLVPQAVSLSADEDIVRLLGEGDYDPKQVVYISGEPFEQGAVGQGGGTAEIIAYEHTRVDVRVSSQSDTWLIVTDSTTPKWETSIDGEPAPYYVANTVFKAARVPAGEHVVSWQYHSPAVARGRAISLTAVLILVGLLALPYRDHELV
ncbi:hypothetical protein CL628_04115 [bacterium]|nr:hypothetical protein [bacterium]